MKTLLTYTCILGFIMMSNAQMNKADSLKNLLPADTEETELEIYLHLVRATYRYSLQDCYTYSSKAYQLSRKINDPASERISCYYLAELYLMRGQYDSALLYNNYRLKMLEESGDSMRMSATYSGIGRIYISLGDYKIARDYYFRALELAELIDELELVMMVYNNLVTSYKAEGEYVTAINYGLKALAIAEELGLIGSQAKALINIGIIYGEMGEFQKALENNSIARQLFIKAQIPQGIALAESNMGLAHMSMGDIDSAIYYYDKALHRYQMLKNKVEMLTILLNIGTLHKNQGELDEALGYYKEILLLADSIGKMKTKAGVLNNIGSVLIEKQEYRQAENAYLESLDLSMQGAWLENIRDSYSGLARLYRRWKKMDKAFQYLEKSVEIKDSIYDISSQRAITEMQTRFDTDKVEKENEILTQEAEIQSLEFKRQQTRFWIFAGGIGFIILLAILGFIFYRLRQRNLRTQLEKQSLENEQRMLRSQMNPHFIFNSMNSIQSYISGNDNNTAMTYLSKFARLMRGILENSRQSMIPLEDEVETLTLYVELERLRFKNKFEFIMELDPGLDQEGMYVPPMLIQPFVENAIKHGLVNQGGDGLLKLSFIKEDKVIKCFVEDNGIGREKASATKTQNGKAHRSLGMQVTRERMDAINKEMDIDCDFKITDLNDEHGKACGTLVEILIPFEEE